MLHTSGHFPLASYRWFIVPVTVCREEGFLAAGSIPYILSRGLTYGRWVRPRPSSWLCYANLAAYRITRRVARGFRVCQPHSARHTAKSKSSWSDSRHGSKAMLPVAMLVVRE
jgi:hypothetical protein